MKDIIESVKSVKRKSFYILKHKDLDGNIKLYNLITNEGKAEIIDRIVSGSTSQYYFSIYSGSYTPSVNETALTYPSNAIEIVNQYSEETRPVCNIIRSGNKWVSTSPGEFTITSPVTVKGIAILTSSVKGGTSGKLISVGPSVQGDIVISSGTLSVEWQSNIED